MKQFQVAKDVFVSHVGAPVILKKYLQDNKDYAEASNDNKAIYEKNAFDQLMAFAYLQNANTTKYGLILVGLHAQQSLNNDQYPHSITKTNIVLSNH